MTTMSSRERMLTVLARRQPDRVPVALGFFPFTLPEITPRNADEYFDTDIRYVEFEPRREEHEFTRYLESLPSHVHLGQLPTLRTYWEWGYHPHQPGSERLTVARTLEELPLNFLPNLTAPERHRSLAKKVRAFHDRGLAVMGIPPHFGGEIFETAWRLRGFSQLLVDLFENRNLVEYLFDQIAAMTVHNAAVLARAEVDLLCLDDDVGMPTSMLISPTQWREFLKPRLARIIQTARAVKPDLFIFYHSDGYIEPIIPDLIEIGVDVLNPVQPDVMDQARLKVEYGDRLAFWGGVGTPTLWAWGTPADVKAEVRECMATLGKGGGYVVCPAYDLEPEIPWANVLAFFEAVQEYGEY